MTPENSSDNINLTPISSPTEIEYSIEGTVVDSTIAGWEDKGITKNTKLDGFEYEPFTYSTSKESDAGVPLGFREKIIGMKKGETKTIMITPEIGYGENHPLANETVFIRLKVENIK